MKANLLKSYLNLLLSWLVKANLLKSYLNLLLLLSWLVKANLLKSYLNYYYYYYYYYYSSETKFLTATPPRALTLQTPNSAQIFRLISRGVLYLF